MPCWSSVEWRSFLSENLVMLVPFVAFDSSITRASLLKIPSPTWLQMSGTLCRPNKIFFILVSKKIMLEFGKFRPYEIGNVMKMTPSFTCCSLSFVFIFLKAAHCTGYFFVFFQRYSVCACARAHTYVYVAFCMCEDFWKTERVSEKLKGAGMWNTLNQKRQETDYSFLLFLFCFLFSLRTAKGKSLKGGVYLLREGGLSSFKGKTFWRKTFLSKLGNSPWRTVKNEP